ncbi:MAG: fasciclin domain-containing protein, partial [Bacteroidales bacterium]|nr:fasciclin domain-containing protein [Bacteroidales bacterium]
MRIDPWILKLSVIIFFICTSCEKEFDKYYQVPDDLIGTILDVLAEDGNYTQFIKAVELVEFDDVLGKTGNFTVFAPNDAAFTSFLSESGYGSLEDIPEEELKGIVFYHIVFWAYSKFMLQYGLNIQDVDIDYTTVNFKRPTRYTPPKSVEYDTLGRRYNVYHETKYVPVYSTEFFTELDLDATTNYSFLYPGTTFNGFHVDRAEITEDDVPAQNGWIHRINRVLVPPMNHGEILEQREELSTFHALVEEFKFYQYNSGYTSAQDNEGDVDEDGILDSLFLKMNALFPPGSSPDVENVAFNGYENILTLFAPTDQALQDFLTNRTKGYSSLDQIGEFWIWWYLSHYIGTNYWPSQFSTLTDDWDWDLTSSLVDCNITEGDIYYSQMASNGPFSGINKYFLPKVFESVAEPVMGDREYESFSNMLAFYLVD